MRKILLYLLSLTLFLSCVENKQEFYSPSVIGVPPQNAYTGLVKLENGEIRHYGREIYTRSIDNGVSWDTVAIKDGRLYGKRSPVTGEYIRLFAGAGDDVYSARSSGGIDGEWFTELIDTNGAIMLKPVVFIKNGLRAIVAFHTKYRNGCGSYYSDDNGLTWIRSNQVNSPPHKSQGFHKGQRWNHGAVEPSIVELRDGRLWMLIRTAQDHLYESFSSDGGETWAEPVPSRFYSTITMPTIQRLENGSILLLWCNTTPLPEVENRGDRWEDVFTNRDVIHAAISDDDGKSWKGFREIYLNPLRNDRNMATKFGKKGSNDRSVHQSEFIELDEDNILISLGQHPNFRALIKMNVNWLYEKARFDNFSEDLDHWSIHKYIKGIMGHCAYNRMPGAQLVDHPEKPGSSVMQLSTESDTTLLYQNSGALFNFPAGTEGEVTFRLKFKIDFDGMRISLHDRWFNPTDTIAGHYAMYNFDIPGNLAINENYELNRKDWYEFQLKWVNADNNDTGHCELLINGEKNDLFQSLNYKTINGISYIHFLLPLNSKINNGILLESVNAKVE